MRSTRASSCAAAAIAAACVVAVPAAEEQTRSGIPLTVDSIMRGPALVGDPPSDLRWSGDSARLYFERRMHGEEEAATWVVGREGGAPRRLTDEERRTAPLPNGTWDPTRRRQLGVERGDIVVIDTVAGTRVEVTRTTGAESAPRWARRGTHVTFIRDNNVFIVPVGQVAGGALVQLTDVAPRPAEPRLTDSQRFLEEEEERVMDWVRETAARRQLTFRAWEIDTVQLSADGRRFYIHSTEAHPGERHPYALPTSGGERTRLTTTPGFHGGEVSPDDGMFAVIHSTATRPPEGHLMANQAGAAQTIITASPSAERLSHK